MSALRILVGFKVTPDFEALREADWSAGAAAAETGDAADAVDTRFVRRILNCFDESSLEMALRLSEARAAHGGQTSLGAMSVGGKEIEPHLATLAALGYERAARVQPDAHPAAGDPPGAGTPGAAPPRPDPPGARPPGSNLDFAPAAVAALIAAYARRFDHSDLVMLGCRSEPGDSGAVPFLVAEMLDWPCLTGVTEIEPLDGTRLRVTWAADDALLHATVQPPFVLAVGNAVVSHLRVPTLSHRLATRGRGPAVLSAQDLGVDLEAELQRSCCRLVGLEAIDRSRPGVVIPGVSPREKAQTLYDTQLRRLLERL